MTGLCSRAVAVPAPSVPSSAGIHGRRAKMAGLHTDTLLPLKHEKGGPNDHFAPKRQLDVALWSAVVAIATVLRQSAGRPCRFGATWLFSPPLPSENAGQTNRRGRRRRACRQPTAQAHPGAPNPHNVTMRPARRAKWSTAGAIAPTTRQNATVADRFGAPWGSEAAHPPVPSQKRARPAPKAPGRRPGSVAQADALTQAGEAPADPPIEAVWTGPPGPTDAAEGGP